jgi:hypothetical protein
MADDWLPADLYLYRGDTAPVGGLRPVGQGDVFRGLPRVGAAFSPKPDQWKARVKAGDETLAILVAHPCSSRTTAHKLKDELSFAPLKKRPAEWGPPWAGHYSFFPLPGLYRGEDYVADLSEIFPVRSEHLTDRRISCLRIDGLAALLDRLAKNSTRLEPADVPGHFGSEAQRLSFEFDLWEMWAEAKGVEEGFQEWMDGDWEETSTKRRSLRWHFDEIRAELSEQLGVELPVVRGQS